jgi:hypothetical protein
MKTAVEKLKNRRMLMMALSYIIFFLPRFTEYKADPEVHYHMKQGLGIFMAFFAIRGMFGSLAFLGMPYGSVLLLQIVTLVYIFLGIRNVLEDKMHPLPFIGKYAERVF